MCSRAASRAKTSCRWCIQAADTQVTGKKPNGRLEPMHGVELSGRELHWIGHIVAQWGALEHEVFSQTLLTYKDHLAEVPKEMMNNLQFSDVLKLWKRR